MTRDAVADWDRLATHGFRRRNASCFFKRTAVSDSCDEGTPAMARKREAYGFAQNAPVYAGSLSVLPQGRKVQL